MEPELSIRSFIIPIVFFGWVVWAIVNGIVAVAKHRDVKYIIVLSVVLTPLPVTIYLLFTKRIRSEAELELMEYASMLKQKQQQQHDISKDLGPTEDIHGNPPHE
jgi:hypothetical protein